MARYIDNSGIKETCPKIDEIISFIEELNWNQLEDNYSKDFILNIMEEIRDDNKALRDWGNNCYNEKGELQEEVYKLKDDVSDLEKELEDLKNEYKEMEDVVYYLKQDKEELEERIADLLDS